MKIAKDCEGFVRIILIRSSLKTGGLSNIPCILTNHKYMENCPYSNINNNFSMNIKKSKKN